ncbi:MAG TPA: hypothetical protein VGA09_11805, partial [Candidatus Binatia bacterium]
DSGLTGHLVAVVRAQRLFNQCQKFIHGDRSPIQRREVSLTQNQCHGRFYNTESFGDENSLEIRLAPHLAGLDQLVGRKAVRPYHPTEVSERFRKILAK